MIEAPDATVIDPVARMSTAREPTKLRSADTSTVVKSNTRTAYGKPGSASMWLGTRNWPPPDTVAMEVSVFTDVGLDTTKAPLVPSLGWIGIAPAIAGCRAAARSVMRLRVQVRFHVVRDIRTSLEERRPRLHSPPPRNTLSAQEAL
jgi:hypothetical protein